MHRLVNVSIVAVLGFGSLAAIAGSPPATPVSKPGVTTCVATCAGGSTTQTCEAGLRCVAFCFGDAPYAYCAKK